MTNASGGFLASLRQGGARFLTDVASGFVFIEHEDHAPLSAYARQNLQSIMPLARHDSVVLINYDDQLEALLSLDQVVHAPIKDFTTIRTIGLSPHLGQRLLKGSTRAKSVSGGLWTLALDDLEVDEAERALQLLSEHVLRPWVNRCRFTEPFGMIEPQAPDFEAKLLQGQRQLGEGKIVWRRSDDVLRAARGTRESVYSRILRRSLLNSCARMTVIQTGVVRVLSEATGHMAAQTDAAPKPTPEVQAVVNKLQNATAELKEIIQEMPSEKDLDAAEDADQRVEISPREQSPVDNAIAIRERLLRTVSFVDAAKWAKWRGVKSNPSAVLGKYKKPHPRLFAVRSSKQDLYPKFQFADNALPLPVMEEILKVVPKDAHGWSLLSWFEARNALLGGRKPSEVLTQDPASVVAAAARFYSRDD